MTGTQTEQMKARFDEERAFRQVLNSYEWATNFVEWCMRETRLGLSIDLALPLAVRHRKMLAAADELWDFATGLHDGSGSVAVTHAIKDYVGDEEYFARALMRATSVAPPAGNTAEGATANAEDPGVLKSAGEIAKTEDGRLESASTRLQDALAEYEAASCALGNGWSPIYDEIVAHFGAELVLASGVDDLRVAAEIAKEALRDGH